MQCRGDGGATVGTEDFQSGRAGNMACNLYRDTLLTFAWFEKDL